MENLQDVIKLLVVPREKHENLIENQLAPALGQHLVLRPPIKAANHHTIATKAVEQWRRLRSAQPSCGVSLEANIDLAGYGILPAFDCLNSSQFGDSVNQLRPHLEFVRQAFLIADSCPQFEGRELVRSCWHVIVPKQVLSAFR